MCVSNSMPKTSPESFMQHQSQISIRMWWK